MFLKIYRIRWVPASYKTKFLRTVASFSVSTHTAIAFPKSQKATCLMTEAPSEVDTNQLKELKLKFNLS